MIANMTQTLQTTLDDIFHQFQEAPLVFGHGIDSAWDEAVQLVLHVLNLPEDANDEVLDLPVTKAQWDILQQLAKRRILERVPLSYLIQKAWFMGLPFYVDERVLIPRSPMAEWIEKQFQPWIDPHTVKRILEIGTGSACMAIAAAFCFEEAIIDAVDIDSDALAVAKINVEHYALNERVNLLLGDCFDPVGEQKYEVIMTNPPYVSREEMQTLPEEYRHEPQSALEADEEGLQIIIKILQNAARYLQPGGILIGEVGNTKDALAARFPKLPFIWLEQEFGGHGLFVLPKEALDQEIK